MKQWHLTYRAHGTMKTKPIWPEGDPLGVFRVVVLGDEPSTRGKAVTVKYEYKQNGPEGDTFHVGTTTVRTVNAARDFGAERVETK